MRGAGSIRGIPRVSMKKTTVRQTAAATRRRPKTVRPSSLDDLLSDLTVIPGPPGREDEVRRGVIRRIAKHVDDVHISHVGAAHAILAAGRGPRLMISAHMDEVGVIVSHIHASGFARFSLLGYKDPNSLPGHTVRFLSGATAVIRSQTGPKREAGALEGLFLDFGRKGRDQPDVRVGDVGCIVAVQTRLAGRFVGSNAGSRSAVVAVIRAIESITRPAVEVQFVFSVQGEFGDDGGLTSAAALGPQSAIVVAPARADDTPGTANPTIRLGAGPVIAVRHAATASEPALVEALLSLANKGKIACQTAVLEDGLPGSAIPAALGGVKTAWVCIPCRGLGTTAEMVEPDDVGATARLLTALARSYRELP